MAPSTICLLKSIHGEIHLIRNVTIQMVEVVLLSTSAWCIFLKVACYVHFACKFPTGVFSSTIFNFFNQILLVSTERREV